MLTDINSRIASCDKSHWSLSNTQQMNELRAPRWSKMTNQDWSSRLLLILLSTGCGQSDQSPLWETKNTEFILTRPMYDERNQVPPFRKLCQFHRNLVMLTTLVRTASLVHVTCDIVFIQKRTSIMLKQRNAIIFPWWLLTLNSWHFALLICGCEGSRFRGYDDAEGRWFTHCFVGSCVTLHLLVTLVENDNTYPSISITANYTEKWCIGTYGKDDCGLKRHFFSFCSSRPSTQAQANKLWKLRL